MKKQFTNENAAYKYARYLSNKGYDVRIAEAYNYAEQTTIWTVYVV